MLDLVLLFHVVVASLRSAYQMLLVVQLVVDFSLQALDETVHYHLTLMRRLCHPIELTSLARRRVEETGCFLSKGDNRLKNWLVLKLKQFFEKLNDIPFAAQKAEANFRSYLMSFEAIDKFAASTFVSLASNVLVKTEAASSPPQKQPPAAKRWFCFSNARKPAQSQQPPRWQDSSATVPTVSDPCTSNPPYVEPNPAGTGTGDKAGLGVKPDMESKPDGKSDSRSLSEANSDTEAQETRSLLAEVHAPATFHEIKNLWVERKKKKRFP